MKTQDTFLQSLKLGDVCLTATNRLARQTMLRYDQWMLQARYTAWARPAIYSFDAWVQAQIRKLDNAPRPLSLAQSVFLWETIIRADVAAQGHDLLQIPPTARKARQAARLLEDHRTTFRADDATEDHLAFLRWYGEWQTVLAKNNWSDPIAAVNQLSAAVSTGQVNLPETLVFSGFDDFTPAQRHLQQSLQAAGCTIRFFAGEQRPVSSQAVYAAPDIRAEVTRCACWLRRSLVRNPDARIGIVAPNLDLYRKLITNSFQAELDPAGTLTGMTSATPFNISLGDELLNEGVIFAAMKLLALPNRVAIDEVSWLLRTPYIASALHHAGIRGRADARFRQKGIFELPLWKLPGALRDTGCDNDFQIIVEALIGRRKHGRNEYPGVWAERFADNLRACGWPGDRTLTSREYQAVGKFREVLAELASLDMVSGPLDRAAALRVLQRLCREATFQAESNGSQVQVLGILEAGGLQFDHLWVLGMHASAMPQPTAPNPFIPIAIQRQAQMPHADANHELDYTRRLVDRLANSAPDVIFSWPIMDGDLQNRPAVFLGHLPPAELEVMHSVAPNTAIFTSRPVLERISDYQVEPLNSKKPVRGGTAIVKDQALCPFRAFAHHRLDARGLETPDIGLDNMTRGTLVHSLLEFFWSEVKNHGELNRLSRAQIKSVLETAAQKAIEREEAAKKSDMPVRLKTLEIRRLVNQGEKWLEIERMRSYFEVIEQEQLHEETIGKLHFRTRIDRIDRLEDGTRAIIDYKTGIPDPMQWFESRISEPQLPIYCQKMDNADIGAVLFAVVRNRLSECRFSGIARDAKKFPKLNEKKLQEYLEARGWQSIDQVLESWRGALPELGNAFANGDASVDPVDRVETCKYCDLPTLCRIHEELDWEEVL